MRISGRKYENKESNFESAKKSWKAPKKRIINRTVEVKIPAFVLFPKTRVLKKKQNYTGDEDLERKNQQIFKWY